jgi:hypothetical protein
MYILIKTVDVDVSKLWRVFMFVEINRSREEAIELLSNSSNFEKKELEQMTNNELFELCDSLEMDNWLDELNSNSHVLK